MRNRVATLTVLALVAVATSSSSAPPVRPGVSDRKVDDRDPPGQCKGPPCAVSPYSGGLPAQFELAKMQRLGCDAPFDHAGGIKEGQTSWVGFSCPAHVEKLFKTLPKDFSDACLPKRHGRVYVPVFEGTCSVQAVSWSGGPLNEKAQKLGCGPLFRYMTGNGSGLLGGIGAYCPDTPALRNGKYSGYVAPYCDGCLRVPAGQAFVLFELFVGPNCPGGCAHSAGAGPI